MTPIEMRRKILTDMIQRGGMAIFKRQYLGQKLNLAKFLDRMYSDGLIEYSHIYDDFVGYRITEKGRRYAQSE